MLEEQWLNKEVTMSDATLEMMQEIEQAAQGVIVGYEAPSWTNRTGSRDRLATVAQHYDEISNWSDEKTWERTRPLTKDLEETVARNDAKVQQAMTDKSESWS